jgi:hypothetical protein
MARPPVLPSAHGTASALRGLVSFAAPWLACTFPYRRFARALTDTPARLGADVARYAFIVTDLHPLLLAGLPAHPKYHLRGLHRTSILVPWWMEDMWTTLVHCH